LYVPVNAITACRASLNAAAGVPLAEADGVALEDAVLAPALPGAAGDADVLCGMGVNVSEGAGVPHAARLAATATIPASMANERASIPVLMWRKVTACRNTGVHVC
jgi:hypothetical protein